ncbi:MAG: hypothetical protein AAF913_15675 [Pseudomonadota bacterium]
MTIRLLAIAAGALRNRIVERLVELSDGEVELALTIGNDSADLKATSMSSLSARRGTSGHVMDDDTFHGANLPLATHADYPERLGLFIEHLSRRSDAHAFKSHTLSQPHDYEGYYHILADALMTRIREARVTHVLFFDIPHLGHDTLVLDIARDLELKTVIVTQSLFPNQFFSMSDPANYGRFPRSSEAPPIAIAQDETPDLFYMKGIKQERDEPGRITPRAMLSLATFLATKRPLQALNPFYLARTLKQMREIYGGLPKWRDPFARFFHENEFAFFEHLVTHEDTPVDLDRRFVYMPLQLQPEMTTASLGGAFRDQALAIEALAALLPPEVSIYVKENPKQGAYMRGPLFFHRLRRIPNVVFLPSYANTHALLTASEFVATITGTVGWEAIRKGKPALIFGRAWYGDLPGVIRYREGLSYQEIRGMRFEHSALEAVAGALVARLHAGVIEKNYRAMVPKFNKETNATSVATALLALLRGEAESVFPAGE